MPTASPAAQEVSRKPQEVSALVENISITGKRQSKSMIPAGWFVPCPAFFALV
jgi:hypothetical protein